MLPLLIFNEHKQVVTDTRYTNVLEIMNKDDIDYDGMGNQGRVPKYNEDTKDWYLIFLCFMLLFLTILLVINILP